MKPRLLFRIAALVLATLAVAGTTAGCDGMSGVSTPTVKTGVSAAHFEHATVQDKCQMCHEAERPTGPVGPERFDHAHGGTGDCVSCHRPGAGHQWSGAEFDHNPTPKTCAECHEDAKPKEIVHHMNHAKPELPDCVTCHDATNTKSFQGGRFKHHNPTPEACELCHAPERPTALVGDPPFDHSHGGTGDCVHCHVQGAGRTWKEVHFKHDPLPKHCDGCHAVDRPKITVGPEHFDHSKGGTGDCKSCHAENAGVKWAGGHFNHSPTPESCNTCHLPDKPVERVDEMLHSHVGLPDCVACHGQDAGDGWWGGNYKHDPVPTSCEDCHGPQRPEKPVGKDSFVHSERGTGDCAFCHSKNVGKDWTEGHMHHRPTPPSCLPCHEIDRPKIAKLPAGETPPADHYGRQDCASCHQTPSKPAPKYAFNHLTSAGKTVATCASCHQAAGVKAHDASVKECNICHLGTSDWKTVVHGASR